jgi:hypothetical protein
MASTPEIPLIEADPVQPLQLSVLLFKRDALMTYRLKAGAIGAAISGYF